MSDPKRKPAADRDTGDFPITLMRWKNPDYAAILRTRLDRTLDFVEGV